MAFKTPKPTYDALVVEKIEEYLDQDYQTEIEGGETYPDDGIEYTYARGRRKRRYTRPMFQVLPDVAFSGAGTSLTPCQCDRFDRSWNCELHPEIDWDPERHRWKRPCTGDRTLCGCDTCDARRDRAAERSGGYIDTGTDGLRPPQAIIDAYNRALTGAECPCAGCRAGRGEAPTGDGRVFSRLVARAPLDRIPVELMADLSVNRDRLLTAPQDVTFTMTGTLTGSFRAETSSAQIVTMEIDCETVQGSGPLAIEVESSDGSTRTTP